MNKFFDSHIILLFLLTFQSVSCRSHSTSKNQFKIAGNLTEKDLPNGVNWEHLRRSAFKICRSSSTNFCGSAALISEEGHLVTASHNLPVNHQGKRVEALQDVEHVPHSRIVSSIENLNGSPIVLPRFRFKVLWSSEKSNHPSGNPLYVMGEQKKNLLHDLAIIKIVDDDLDEFKRHSIPLVWRNTEPNYSEYHFALHFQRAFFPFAYFELAAKHQRQKSDNTVFSGFKSIGPSDGTFGIRPGLIARNIDDVLWMTFLPSTVKNHLDKEEVHEAIHEKSLSLGPGGSGAAVVDSKGRMVGVLTSSQYKEISSTGSQNTISGVSIGLRKKFIEDKLSLFEVQVVKTISSEELEKRIYESRANLKKLSEDTQTQKVEM